MDIHRALAANAIKPDALGRDRAGKRARRAIAGQLRPAESVGEIFHDREQIPDRHAVIDQDRDLARW